MQQFGINAYPSILLFAPEWEVQAQFHWQGPQSLPENLPRWARQMVQEWTTLFQYTRVLRLDAENFQTQLTASQDMWLVLYTTQGCSTCSDAKPNFYRLSRELHGMVNVAIADCSLMPVVCSQANIPSANYPHLMLYPTGNKTLENLGGELLYSDREMESHLVMPLIAKILRAATAAQRTDTDVSVPAPEGSDDYEKEKKEEEEPPMPPPHTPQYHVPPPRPVFQQLPPAARNRNPRLT